MHLCNVEWSNSLWGNLLIFIFSKCSWYQIERSNLIQLIRYRFLRLDPFPQWVVYCKHNLTWTEICLICFTNETFAFILKSWHFLESQKSAMRQIFETLKITWSQEGLSHQLTHGIILTFFIQWVRNVSMFPWVSWQQCMPIVQAFLCWG